ncbi:FAD-dependent oxidoreductase [Loktanella sp. D2R18]|uniref:NAD(P)/FAD-dependent oxidoreductase n=1 Tax=Rhodobacterales TaxID=204455 RepID=UPI000DE9A5AE|nr:MULTISPECIES: FAD-binding oxidoreductase [Rhodobacterales]MDO6589428.1 FAD-binding oxidoreductase [Yoonia sp. 1_MG-2023]RBW45165.1 FAD-dependent oxidoreductase [Loktanella sp. D2R18]
MITRHADKDPVDQPHVIVVGGGMVGIATAIWSLHEGNAVTLIDKSAPEDRASYGNAGVLASASVLPVTMPGLLTKLPKMVLSRTEPIFLRWLYLPRIALWATRYLSHANATDVRRISSALFPIVGNSLEDHFALSKGTEAEAFIKPCDFAVLYKDRDTFLKDAFGWKIRSDLGFKWSEHDGANRDSYDPVFNKSLGFLAALAGHGQITDPAGYMEALRKYLVAAGGRILSAEVTNILHENGHATGVMTTDGPVTADRIAITAGAWSPLLTKKLGVKIPVEAETGYHIEFWDPSFVPRVPTLVPSKKLIFSQMKGRLRVAGAVEFGGLKNKGQDKVFELLKAATKDVLPDLTYSKETRWVGHRPAPTDSVPIIDELSTIKGVFLGFGHQHVGLTGSARTGQILAQLISGKRPNIDLTPYSAARFTMRRQQSGPTLNTPQHKETA